MTIISQKYDYGFTDKGEMLHQFCVDNYGLFYNDNIFRDSSGYKTISLNQDYYNKILDLDFNPTNYFKFLTLENSFLLCRDHSMMNRGWCFLTPVFKINNEYLLKRINRRFNIIRKCETEDRYFLPIMGESLYLPIIILDFTSIQNDDNINILKLKNNKNFEKESFKYEFIDEFTRMINFINNILKVKTQQNKLIEMKLIVNEV